MIKKLLFAASVLSISFILQLISQPRAEPLFTNELCPRIDHSVNPISFTDSGAIIELNKKGIPFTYYTETQVDYCELGDHIDSHTNTLLLLLNLNIIVVSLSSLAFLLRRMGAPKSTA